MRDKYNNGYDDELNIEEICKETKGMITYFIDRGLPIGHIIEIGELEIMEGKELRKIVKLLMDFLLKDNGHEKYHKLFKTDTELGVMMCELNIKSTELYCAL